MKSGEGLQSAPLEEPVARDGERALVEDSLIARLPFEILASILAQIALDSPKAFVRTLLIGRAFWIPHNSALLWEPVCRATYPELGTELLHAEDYGGYYEMFRRRPTVRYNGVYICVSRYFREGEPEGISFYKPKLEVRYYRYMWLRPDGTARSLLSNHEPRSVLGLDGTHSSSSVQDAMDGRWSLDPHTKQLSVVVDGGAKRKNDFHFDMEVASSGGKVHNKLKWRRYWCEEHGTANTAEFGLQNEGSFFFCRLL